MPGGTITLNPSRGASVTVIDAGATSREGGTAVWQSSDRALRRPALWFQGITNESYSITGILDFDAVPGPSIERRLRALQRMGLPGDADEPPTLKLDGDIWDRDRNLTWVLTGLTLGEKLYFPDGTLRRQSVSLSVSRFVDLKDVDDLTVGRTRGRSGRRRRRVIKSRKGDTLRSIAVRELGAVGRWKDLRRWNKKLAKVDPDHRLRVGTEVAIR